MYLGSSMHGGSLTILQAYKLTHLISIDELPNWWHTLKKYYKFDFQLQDEDKDENNHGKIKVITKSLNQFIHLIIRNQNL